MDWATVVAILQNPMFSTMLKDCKNEEEFKSKYATVRSSIDGAAQKYRQQAAQITAGVTPGATAPATGSIDTVVNEFIDSVRVVAAALQPATVKEWLETDGDSNATLAGIKDEFKRRFAENPSAASVYLRQKQTDILIAKNWI